MMYDNLDRVRGEKKEDRIKEILFNPKEKKDKSESQEKTRNDLQFIVDWQIMH